MKNIPTTIAMLAALAGSAAAAPYVLPSPQPGALTSYDWQPVYAIEGLYGIAQESDLPDTYGVRGSFNLYSSAEDSTFRHQFNVNVAATWGSDDTELSKLMPQAAALLPDGHRADIDLFVMPVTAGYNLNIGLSESVSLFLGAKAGYAWSRGEISTSFAGNHFSESKSAGGFTYSVGGGLKIQCSESVYVHAGYEFGRSYLDYNIEGKDIIYGAHTISLGIGARF